MIGIGTGCIKFPYGWVLLLRDTDGRYLANQAARDSFLPDWEIMEKIPEPAKWYRSKKVIKGQPPSRAEDLDCQVQQRNPQATTNTSSTTRKRQRSSPTPEIRDNTLCPCSREETPSPRTPTAPLFSPRLDGLFC